MTHAVVGLVEPAALLVLPILRPLIAIESESSPAHRLRFCQVGDASQYPMRVCCGLGHRLGEEVFHMLILELTDCLLPALDLAELCPLLEVE